MNGINRCHTSKGRKRREKGGTWPRSSILLLKKNAEIHLQQYFGFAYSFSRCGVSSPCACLCTSSQSLTARAATVQAHAGSSGHSTRFGEAQQDRLHSLEYLDYYSVCRCGQGIASCMWLGSSSASDWDKRIQLSTLRWTTLDQDMFSFIARISSAASQPYAPVHFEATLVELSTGSVRPLLPAVDIQ